MPAVAGEAFADGGDHVVEAADVGVDVEDERLFGHQFFDGDCSFGGRPGYGRGGGCGGEAAGFDDVAEIFLDVAAAAVPLFAGAAESGDVVEILVLFRDALEVVAVVKLALVAGAIDEPELLALAAVFAGVHALFG